MAAPRKNKSATKASATQNPEAPVTISIYWREGVKDRFAAHVKTLRPRTNVSARLLHLAEQDMAASKTEAA